MSVTLMFLGTATIDINNIDDITLEHFLIWYVKMKPKGFNSQTDLHVNLFESHYKSDCITYMGIATKMLLEKNADKLKELENEMSAFIISQAAKVDEEEKALNKEKRERETAEFLEWQREKEKKRENVNHEEQ